ncbi:hypothetical protein BSK71_13330 [Pectobacterium actinidiae]|uniref:Aminotransferase n=2 Tax=Pectobacterium actinidiae TaxID=1507808 RepID=A0A1V2R2R6_9GAMM|nr:hypothetical protein KKH3_19300 [Pectobacterium actinidiae]ONK03670.1 hypothetical protein BSK69_13385 [Pectobacterium actinidiae]ONK05398.1 hypothetical protein BSK71_13330 [Pectobacterium actinidiae]GKW15169.1 hypothetical protein PEC301937_11180 [Pectobacterium carotovorum subsp. carotovorum]GLW37302.1 hypothetical protein Pcaca04_12380 [Pectobacterium carotovorum subsp. carotovorum]
MEHTEMDNKHLLLRAMSSTAAKQYDVEARPPFVVNSAQGAWLKDCDERAILDMTSSNGTTLFGYRREDIDNAVIEQLTQRGTIFPTTLSPQRIELAERLIDRYPAAEKAVFFRTGSDGTSAAIRMARAYTGKRIILSSGYHGWHDWHRLFGKACFDKQTEVFHFGYNLSALSQLLEHARDCIAGVIVTPEPGWYDESHFQAMYQLCKQAGVPFILDEVMSGLRYGAAGLNGAGVSADLVVISKGLANGHALSCVAGKADIINAYDAAGLAGTYNKEVTPMAAALTVLRILEEEKPHETACAVGAELMQGMQNAADKIGFPLWVTGAPLMFKTVFSSAALADAVTASCFSSGLFLECGGTHMINFAFGAQERDYAIDCFAQALKEVSSSGLADDVIDRKITESQRKMYARDAFGAAFEEDEDITHQIAEALGYLGLR